MEEGLLSGIAHQAAAEISPPPADGIGTLRLGLGVAFSYPFDHLPAGPVPVGGSMCANCRFAVADAPGGATCTEPDFIAAELPGKPAGTGLLPLPPDQFCSDWWRAIAPPPEPTP